MTGPGYDCSCCGHRHDELPLAYGTVAPAFWHDGLAGKPGCLLDEELCKIDNEHFFVRARLVLPLRDAEEEFEWGVWVSLSEPNFRRTIARWDDPAREDEPPYFGFLSTELPGYPVSTLRLKTNVHTQPPGVRPVVELEPTDHPLAVEQRTGIDRARVQEIAELVLHPPR